MAAAHGVTARTVRNWKKASKEPPRKEGRPRYSEEERKHALWAVGRERRRQGKRVGWRRIEEGLGKTVPTRLVQQTLKRFKARDRLVKRRRIERSRQRVVVQVSDAIWTQDGTHLGRVGGRAVKGLVIKDRGSMRKVSMWVGHRPNAEDVKNLLEETKQRTGRLPLVWQTDNDSIYREEDVMEYLKKEKIVTLYSRVHTPPDNGAAEIGMRELKEISGLGKGVKLRSVEEAAVLLGKSAVQLNENRLRGSKGYLSANALAETMPSCYNTVDRNRFYQEACRAKEVAVQDKKPRAAKHAKRQAVFLVMEKYNLITITRGGKPRNGH